MSHKIVVSVRVRPLRDEATGASVVRPEPDGVSIAGRRVHGFNSVVVGPDQSVAHEAIAAPLLGQLMEGYSCTLLAYGQTGSGKTHTVSSMHELVLTELLGEPNNGGGDGGAGTARIAVCVAEVYLDQVRDLADEASKTTPASMTQSSLHAGITSGEIALTWHACRDASEAQARVAAATERRVTADNGLNSRSSRSHLIVVYALCGDKGARKGLKTPQRPAILRPSADLL